MDIVSTTIHCSTRELELIKKCAKKRELTVINFINVAIRDHLPVKEITIFGKEVNRTDQKIGAQIPKYLHDQVIKNRDELTTPFQKVAMYHVVLTAVLMECEG
jgi:hypothetical protein